MVRIRTKLKKTGSEYGSGTGLNLKKNIEANTYVHVPIYVCIPGQKVTGLKEKKKYF